MPDSTTGSRDRAVPFTAVSFDDSFWAPRQRAVRLASRDDEDLRRRAPVPRDLNDDVGGGAEAEEGERLTVAQVREAQGAIADDAGAEQRRGLNIGEPIGDRIRERLGRDDVLGVPAIDVLARPARARAEVLVAREAGGARAARPVDPRDADALAGLED